MDELFVKSELIPVVIQEYKTKEVLMLGFMNKESLQKTIETGYTWFYSRSRRKLWNKGETSGHVQRVISIKSDCDNDTLLIEVEQTGAACHTGSKSCFFNKINF
jgi:phosphoribosyl-AMP cyclohydrolase